MTECPNHAGAFDCTPFCALCEGNQEIICAVPGSEFQNLEKLAKAYLVAIRRGKFFAARDIANSLNHAAYVLDPVWTNAQKRK